MTGRGDIHPNDLSFKFFIGLHCSTSRLNEAETLLNRKKFMQNTDCRKIKEVLKFYVQRINEGDLKDLKQKLKKMKKKIISSIQSRSKSDIVTGIFLPPCAPLLQAVQGQGGGRPPRCWSSRLRPFII
jgi:hypothetical protein